MIGSNYRRLIDAQRGNEIQPLFSAQRALRGLFLEARAMHDQKPLRPPFLVSTEDVPEEPGRYPKSDEILSHGRALGKAAGLERIGLHIERLPPGHRTSYPHAEADEEEFVFVLEGTVDAWIDGVLHPMRKGDLAAFPAATGIAHTFLNNGVSEAILLVGGDRSKPGNRIFYPLNAERRAQMPPEQWWTNPPNRVLGNHNGVARMQQPKLALPENQRGLASVTTVWLETPRLILRRFRASDSLPFAALNADPEVMKYFPSPLSREESDAGIARVNAHFDLYGYGFWALERKDTGELIGFAGLLHTPFETPFTPCVEIGWRLARAHWGLGFASEAARAALQFGFGNLRLAEIVAFTVPTNLRSRRVMERLGMRHDPQGDFEHPRVSEGHPLRRHVLYRLLARDFV